MAEPARSFSNVRNARRGLTTPSQDGLILRPSPIRRAMELSVPLRPTRYASPEPRPGAGCQIKIRR